jgi:hypothetical protein
MGGVVMTYSYEVRETFLQFVCAGASLRTATAAVGVSHGVGLRWWQTWGRMELQIVTDRRGGLRGTAHYPWPATRVRMSPGGSDGR